MSVERPDILQIFNDAAEMSDPEERMAYLDRACGDNQKLRAEVEGLLDHDAELGSLQDAPGAGIAPTIDAGATEQIGAQIDRYKLVHEIGHGGMGVVYMAVQSSFFWDESHPINPLADRHSTMAVHQQRLKWNRDKRRNRRRNQIRQAEIGSTAKVDCGS